MPVLVAPRRALLGAALLGVAAPVRACIVGDLQGPPQIVITMAPPDCCYAAWGGTLAGTVRNVDTDNAVVVLYAQTDVYYVEPFVSSLVRPSCGGVWSSSTHGGARYAAVLARPSWPAPAVLAELPAVGGAVLAVATAPDSQRRLEFAGRTWIVKSSGDVPFGPGPNLWSDSPANVWVDADGLHLRLVEQDGVWTCAEVMSEAYVGHGRLRFEVVGAIDRLDPAVVFGGFFYADQGTEADIEWSRWGDPASFTNAQFAVQPALVQPLALALSGATSAHEIVWFPGRIDFAIWDGATPSTLLAAWSHVGTTPTPAFERVHFNLWLANGVAPQGGAMEVVVRSFLTAESTDARLVSAPRASLRAETFTGARLRYGLQLPEATIVRLRLFDPRGRLVAAAAPLALAAGAHSRSWDLGAEGLARGVYFLRADGTGTPLTSRLLVLR